MADVKKEEEEENPEPDGKRQKTEDDSAKSL